MSKYVYPRMPRSEIVSILANAQIVEISENDLLKPNTEFISELYVRILIFVDFLNEEDHGQVEFDALEQLENPDLHVDSAKIVKLCNRMKEVMASLECPKRFTLKDLIKPDTDRTELFISALLNYCVHKDAKMELLSSMFNELTLLREQRQEWEDKITELNAEIAKYNEARERDLPLVQAVDVKVKELHQTIAGLNNHQASLRASLRKLKEKNGELDGKISCAEFALVQCVQENANLRSKVVQSPEKLQRTLEEKKSVREEAKNKERLAMQSFQEKTATVEVYLKVLKKMKKCFDQMQAIQEQVNSAKSVDKEYKVLRAKLSDEVVLDKSLEAKLLERQGRLEELEETKKQLEKERDVRCEEAFKKFNQVKMEVESQRRHLEARQKNVEAVVSKVDAVTSKSKLVKEAAAAQQQELLLKCEEVVKEFQEYNNRLCNSVPMDLAKRMGCIAVE